MRINKTATETQRRLIDEKLTAWLPLREQVPPMSGWLKAIRGALGISSRQLAQIIGVDMSSVIRLEDREPSGKVTLEMLDRTAQAMGCRLIYAIVPDDKYQSLEAILDHRSRQVAKELLNKVEHSMHLEAQDSPHSKDELERVSYGLKQKMDPRIWGLIKKKKRPKAT